MKLFIYCPFIAAGKGGLERVGTELANNMSARGHETILGFNKRDNNLPKYEVANKVKLFAWNNPYKELKNELQKMDPDVFFVFNGGYRFIEFYSAVADTGIPFAIQESTNPVRLVSDNWSRLRRVPLGQAALERELVASGAVRIRQTMPSYAQSLPDYIQPQIRFFPNAVIPAERQSNLIGTENAKTIINIGGLKKVKNIFPLLESFKQLSKEYPDWKIKIYGGGFHNERDYQKSIHEFIKSAGLVNSILILGETDLIYQAYEKSQIHVITSKDEGRPTCVCETMAHGLPSVGFTTTPGVNELIKHNVNGLLVNYSETGVKGLTNELSRLMANAQLRLELGKNAFEDAKEFSPDKIYDRWESFFSEASGYKNKTNRLFFEQNRINPILAFHALRMRSKYLLNIVT